MKLRAPNVFVLISAIVVLVGCLTWVIPAGKFDRETKTILVQGKKKTKKLVVRGSYKTLEERAKEAHEKALAEHPAKVAAAKAKGEKPPKAPKLTIPDKRQRPWHWFMAPIKGFVESAAVIGFILLVGGAFGVLNRTGAILAFLTWATSKAQGNAKLAIVPGLTFLFSLGGATFGMSEETIAFILITVPLAISLGYDTITGIAIPFVGSQAGFAAAFLNPFTLGIAKGIAEVPFDDGFLYRVVCWFIVTGLCAAFVTWHAMRVARDPSKSPTPDLDEYWRKHGASDGGARQLTKAHLSVLIGFAVAMLALAIGAVELGWYIDEMCGIFLAMALLCGLLGKLSLGEIADSLVDGAKDLAGAALLVAFARGTKVVAQDGEIIDTILNSVSEAVQGFGPVWSAECMFGVQTAFNFFVPSGSGQAALTMPIMAPLADLVNVSREGAILAYQFGDGFTNMIIPTNAVLVGVLAMAKLEYAKWFRWMLPFQVVLFLVGMLLLWIGLEAMQP